MSVFQFSEHPEVLWADLYLNIGGSIGKSAVANRWTVGQSVLLMPRDRPKEDELLRSTWPATAKTTGTSTFFCNTWVIHQSSLHGDHSVLPFSILILCSPNKLYSPATQMLDRNALVKRGQCYALITGKENPYIKSEIQLFG